MSWSKGGKIVSSSASEALEETTLSQTDSKSIWDQETEEEFLQRVRDRANKSAKEIIEQAQVEAEQIKQNAYNEGISAAREEIDKQTAQMKQNFQNRFNSLLSEFQKEMEKHWNAHKSDIVQLIKLAVEKIVNKEMQEDRMEILSGLLDESLQMLDNRRGVVLYLNKEDREYFQEAIEQAKNRFANLQEWKIEVSSRISPGGVLLENSESKVENSLEQRWEVVSGVLDKIFGENG